MMNLQRQGEIALEICGKLFGKKWRKKILEMIPKNVDVSDEDILEFVKTFEFNRSGTKVLKKRGSEFTYINNSR